MNLRIEPGTVLGIVGGTGIGKTTLQHLLSRVLDVKQGKVVIAGKDVASGRSVNSAACLCPFRNMAVCCSHTVASSDTIRFGRRGATMAEVIEAARCACIHDDIERMPQGYDTVLGPGGVHLSKGQQQGDRPRSGRPCSPRSQDSHPG